MHLGKIVEHFVDMLKSRYIDLTNLPANHIQRVKSHVAVILTVDMDQNTALGALFTNVPGKEVVDMAVHRAESDTTWKDRTKLTPSEFGELIQVVVDTTYFQYNNW